MQDEEVFYPMFTSFRPGDVVRNEDGAFIAKLVELGNDGTRNWMLVAIDNFFPQSLMHMITPYENMSITQETRESEEEEGRRLLRIEGPKLSKIKKIVNQLCSFISINLSGVKDGPKDSTASLLELDCDKLREDGKSEEEINHFFQQEWQKLVDETRRYKAYLVERAKVREKEEAVRKREEERRLEEETKRKKQKATESTWLGRLKKRRGRNMKRSTRH